MNYKHNEWYDFNGKRVKFHGVYEVNRVEQTVFVSEDYELYFAIRPEPFKVRLGSLRPLQGFTIDTHEFYYLGDGLAWASGMHSKWDTDTLVIPNGRELKEC